MSVAEPQSPTWLEVMEACLQVYAAVYREEVTEQLFLGYHEALKELRNPRLLRAAFTRATLSTKFRPTPAEIREAYNLEAEEEQQTQRELRRDEPETDYRFDSRIVLNGRPVIDEVREVAKGISQEMFGKPYRELDREQVFECISEAQKRRLARLGKGKS